jgi:hypothetical protein
MRRLKTLRRRPDVLTSHVSRQQSPNKEVKVHLEAKSGCLTHPGAAPTFLRQADNHVLLLVAARQQSRHIQAESALRP